MKAVTIGLEVHVQLRTGSKLFCSCPTDFGAPPNTQVCPVCLGLPGSLPVLNKEAAELAVRAALALGCRVNLRSEFDRKHYFYPDLAKGFQITQERQPLASGGALELATGRVALARLHIEEDAAKLIHRPGATLIDYNRSGLPLVEIVTEPCLSSVEQVGDFLANLRRGLEQAGVTDGKLAEGSLRCDVNVSLAGGERTEIKNLNSFRGVAQALKYEIERQESLLDRGEKIPATTRRWHEERGETLPMRSKMTGGDYCFCPEPDLLPLVLSQDLLAKAGAGLPEMPWLKRARFCRQYSLPDSLASLLSCEQELAACFEAIVAEGGKPRAAAKLLLGPLSYLRKGGRGTALSPSQLVGLLRLEEEGSVSATAAKEMLARMYANPGTAASILRAKEYRQISDRQLLREIALKAIADSPEPVADYLAGKERALGSLMGKAMELSRGQANPSLLKEILLAELGNKI